MIPKYVGYMSLRVYQTRLNNNGYYVLRMMRTKLSTDFPHHEIPKGIKTIDLKARIRIVADK